MCSRYAKKEEKEILALSVIIELTFEGAKNLDVPVY